MGIYIISEIMSSSYERQRDRSLYRANYGIKTI